MTKINYISQHKPYKKLLFAKNRNAFSSFRLTDRFVCDRLAKKAYFEIKQRAYV